MENTYVELLIKQKTTSATIMKKVAIICGVIASAALLVFVSYLAIIWLALMFVLIYLWSRCSSIEFEYTYCNGEIDIDKILGMQARKRVVTINASDMEILAPTGSPELRPYQNAKVYDCASNSDNKTYEIVTKHKGQKVRVIFEPNEKILEGMRIHAPRKVFM